MSAFNSGTGSNYSGVASIVNANITMKTWDDFQTLLLYVVIGLIASIFVLGQCNLLALEDKTARSLGVNVTRSRIIISVIAVLLASISTAVIGPISFLGLIVRILPGCWWEAITRCWCPIPSCWGRLPCCWQIRWDVPLRHPMRLVLPSSCRWWAAVLYPAA